MIADAKRIEDKKKKILKKEKIEIKKEYKYYY